MYWVAYSIEEFWADLLPVVKFTVNMNRLRFAKFRLGNALKSSNIRDQLVVIGVLVLALHWLAIAAKFCVVLVDKGDGRSAVEGSRYIEPSGDPFVPAGNKDDFRIDLQSALPLFLEVFTGIVAIFGSRFGAVVIASSVLARVAQHAKFSVDCVLSDANAHFFNFALVVIELMLRIGFQPTPLILLRRPHEVVWLRRSKCEEV